LAVWKVPRQCPLVLLVKARLVLGISSILNFKDVGAAVVGEMSDFGRAKLWRNVEKLIFGGLHKKHALPRGIWVPTQH
jgi:hypothetical protein